MYSLCRRILSSSNVIINAITDAFTFISTLYEEWSNYPLASLIGKIV